MLRAFNTSLSSQRIDYTNRELIAYLMPSEWDDRQNRKIGRLTKLAKFRYSAVMENIDYDPTNRRFERLKRSAKFRYSATMDELGLVTERGLNKSRATELATALGHRACSQGTKVLYLNAQKLLAQTKMARLDGSAFKLFGPIEKAALLILDNFGLAHLDKKQQRDLMEIIADRHGRSSTIIASHLPVASWHDIIGEATIMETILDRLLHTSYWIELKRKSQRKKLWFFNLIFV